MSVIADILNKEFIALKNEVIAKYDEKGMRASGDFAQSLDTTLSETAIGYTAQLVGNAYAYQLENGRASSKQAPSAVIEKKQSLRSVIEKWIYDKGIANKIEGKISVSSLAFLIARKIHREGWKRENHGGVNLISEVITDERIQKIIDKVGEVFTIQFSERLINEFKIVS